MLEILNGGLHTTVQDMGRQGGQSLGIPPSGAQDGFALRIANLLAGNPCGGPLIIRGDPGAAGGRTGREGRLRSRGVRFLEQVQVVQDVANQLVQEADT